MKEFQKKIKVFFCFIKNKKKESFDSLEKKQYQQQQQKVAAGFSIQNQKSTFCVFFSHRKLFIAIISSSEIES